MAKCNKDGKMPAKIEPTTDRGRWHFQRRPYSSISVMEYIRKLREGEKHG